MGRRLLLAGLLILPAPFGGETVGARGEGVPRQPGEKRGVSADGADVRISGAASKNGVLVHEATCPYQKGTTHIHVLLPDKLEPDRKYPVIYVLPVEPGNGTRWGSGLEEVRKLNLHNKLNIIFVMPTFSDWPWYCDHPTDPMLRQETYLVAVVVPFIEKTYPASRSAEGRLLLGFSKSGFGAWSLLLRHPNLFGRAAAWDAPLNMAAPSKFGMGPVYGTQENFEKYRIPSLLQRQQNKLTTLRLSLCGHCNFGEHHAEIHQLMTRLGIPHEFLETRRQTHHWNAGWIEDAVRFLAGSEGK